MKPINQSSEALYKRCPVCGRHAGHQNVFQKWNYPILRCEDCGLGSTQLPDQFDLRSVYTQDYFQGKTRDGYADYANSETVLRSEFRRTLAHIRRYAPSTGRLLEIGCAYGFFLMEARAYYTCHGIDVVQEAVEFARQRGLAVQSGIVDEDFLERTGPFDLAVMLDVIEHLPDPERMLTLVHNALADGGCLVISTGDWDSLMAHVTGRHWRLMTPPQHLYFFSRTTLVQMLARVGFEVVDLRRPWKVVPLGLAVYQATQRCRVSLPYLRLLNNIGIPLNLFDAFLVVARKV